VTYNSTDSFIRPTQGIYANASVDFSNALGDEADDFFRYKANFSTYYSPWSFLTLALRGKYGFLHPIARVPAIPKDQLFYLGGVTSVRGFDENLLRYDSLGEALGGREMIMGSLEARIYIGYNLEITAFTDSGELRKTTEGVGESGFRTTAGAGLRYITPIGPVGFLYGRKLSPNDNESKGKWNFTVGYTF
jgi:outer membrane protein insertion porin family